MATSLNNLAGLYRAQGHYTEAEPLFQRSLAIREKALGPEHPHVAQSLENYAALLRRTARANEAERMEARAKAIRAKSERVVPPGSWPRGRDFRYWLRVLKKSFVRLGWS